MFPHLPLPSIPFPGTLPAALRDEAAEGQQEGQEEEAEAANVQGGVA